ncbi:amidase domain-containing protein [Streptomyces sp. NPDC051364]|uniref:amidase domain-containing protein n=1 Tax=Streptomyces sp. NPDC051364 TaxID=3155799 RepID=UPI00342AFCA2
MPFVDAEGQGRCGTGAADMRRQFRELALVGDDARDPAVLVTPQQQKDLMRADPVTLADLKGLPPEVGRELRGPDGKIDRVEMVRYALDHWDKLDDLDFKNNCANFTSSALEAGGMQKKFDFWLGPRGDNTWGRESGLGIERIDRRVYHSRSWGLAKDLHGFLLHNGGEEVARSEARPGDVIFYEQVGPRSGRAARGDLPRCRRDVGDP